MENLFERRAAAAGARWMPVRVRFDLDAAHAEVARRVTSEAPGLGEAVDCLRARVPLLKAATTELDRPWYRLPNHNRSFCCALAEGDDLYRSAVVVVKGTEPFLEDYDRFLEWMTVTSHRRATRVMADHFPLSEGKIPGALALSEADREAALAAELQARHLAAYGAPARLPTPLLVLEAGKERTEQVHRLLAARLSTAAMERIAPMLAGGLGVYAYFYPTAPVRASFWGGGGSPKLSEHVKRTFDAEVAVAGWVRLVARLLLLGYLPYSVRNEGLGACMDTGNATIDGGFCDPDSILAMRACPDDEFFRQSLIESLSLLATTVQALLTGGAAGRDLYPGIEAFAISRYLCRQLERALETESRPGLTLDPRVKQLLSPEAFGDLKACLQRRTRPTYAMFVKKGG
jgi:hypothetical protein